MTRRSSEITRTVNGVTERLCKTPGCGWKPQTREHYGWTMDCGREHWSPYCHPCRRARDGAERERRAKARSAGRQITAAPPPLTWENLLP